MVRVQNMGNYAIMGSYTVKTELYSCIKARLVINKNSSKLSLIQPNSYLYSLIPYSFYSGGRAVLELSYPQSLLPLMSFTVSSLPCNWYQSKLSSASMAETRASAATNEVIASLRSTTNHHTK